MLLRSILCTPVDFFLRTKMAGSYAHFPLKFWRSKFQLNFLHVNQYPQGRIIVFRQYAVRICIIQRCFLFFCLGTQTS